jgi:hypothetical protein
MAHFAELNENNRVLRVIVVDNNITHNEQGLEDESLGVAFLKNIFGENTNWIQASYNGNFRGRFCDIGDLYDPVNDVFVDDVEYKEAAEAARIATLIEQGLIIEDPNQSQNEEGITE